MLRTHARSTGRIVSSFAVIAGAVLVPSLAHAQFDLHDEQTGAEASVHLGYGGFSNNAAFRAPGSGGTGDGLGSFGMQFFLGYRVVPVFSAGLHGGYNLLAVRNNTGSQAADSGTFGIYARVHILSFLQRRTRTYAGTPDLFVGVGWDFFAQVKAWDTNNNVAGWRTGFAFPFQVGFNYAITDNVEVGVLGIASPWTISNSCARIAGFQACNSNATESEAFLYIGLGVSGHFNFLH